MKTRTNQPIYKDDGNLVDDTQLGGSKCYLIGLTPRSSDEIGTTPIYFYYFTDVELDISTKQIAWNSLMQDLRDKGYNASNKRYNLPSVNRLDTNYGVQLHGMYASSDSLSINFNRYTYGASTMASSMNLGYNNVSVVKII